ncbi:phospholipid-transporting ATPase IK, partial [Sceloporus undulatus]|uniref:phospholipid-transporting ATPase IK n=1 Tax=Sceloporus undulatus TaxID=8520 RepID=UPI001C4CEAD0
DRREEEKNSDFTWVVKANDRAYHDQFKERYTWCLKRKKYNDNAIKTAKYNILTFLPFNLYEQFHRMANVYFLFMILLQTVPQISTLPWFALLFPLFILLGIRGIRDLIDDIARHRSDWEINSRPCDILIGKSFSQKKWCDVHVGDIVRLPKDSFVPADLLLLSSSEPNSLCYVETMDIDGETNLKYRQALLVTHEQLSSEENMAAFDGIVTCEEPNSRMHSFIGTLEWREEKYSLDSEKLLLRGCRIRNTEVCYGLVVYAASNVSCTGFDSKIMKNCGKIKVKKTKLNRLMDRLVVLIAVSLFFISFALAVGSGIWAAKFRQEHSYLYVFYSEISAVQYAFFAFFGFVILLSLVIPMSMLITFEFIYLVNSCFINWDVEMYFADKDTPAKARSTSLNDQLGQIQYVFSDKTGTLTQNIMTFKKCCINGKIYGNHLESKLEFYDPFLLETIQQDADPVVQEFMRLLALCHTVMVEEKEGQLVYQAASPDEEALVSAARDLGYVFVSRTQDTITIQELGIERTYKVLAILDFNSVRKRMSILVQDPAGCIRLYTKGADIVILERLHCDRSMEAYTIMALDSFAQETLRTLCLATKEVTAEEYAAWSKKHHDASVLLQGRAQQLDKVYEEMECNLQLLGATAIEDKLQDGVPETIHLLKRGGMKVWVLTGDKQETAVNIGFACQLLSDDMTILEENVLSEILEPSWHSKSSLATSRESLCNGSFQPFQASSIYGKKALVVTGEFLSPKHLEEQSFVDLATDCQAVICCRVTPKQKALIVELVKKYKNTISLAIGDGANDVNMIKTADIGVGISGQEGMQAVQCSDYALAQFRYLQRLLFVHGRWSYLRICKFLRYFFYKTFAGMMVQIWFAFHTGFTAQPLLEGWFLALYNVFYTSCPVLCLGLFEQDVSDKKSLQFPELYKVGQKDRLFNFRTFCVSFVHGSFVSLANFYITMWAMGDRAGVQVIGDYQSFGMIVATSAIVTVMAEIMMEIKFWTIFSALAIVISLAFYCLFSYLTQSFEAYRTSYISFPFPAASRNALTDPTSLLVILLCVVVNVIPSLTMRFVSSFMGLTNMSQMFEARDIYLKEKPVELTSHVRRNTLLRRSSYAFSHKEGYADLISRGASLRLKGPGAHQHMNGFHSVPPLLEEGPVPTETNPAPHEIPSEQTVQFC